MLPPSIRSLAAALLVAAVAPRAQAQSTAPPVDFRVTRSPVNIRLDGKLDEAAWFSADSITDFRQRDPQEGAPGSERTVVRVLATPAGLAVGWWCYDREPARIVRSQLRRDAELRPDDYVSLGVDGLHDKRSGFYFRANANGALWDGEHIDFESGNESWDGIWDVRSRVTADGYVVEMLVPWATLRYADGDSLMGMNFRRFMPRKNEEVLWRAWKRTEGFRFLEKEGLVGGFADLPRRPLVEARPYVSSELKLPERRFFTGTGDTLLARGTQDANIGLDLKLPIGNTLTADVTVNPDFAQAEVDRQVVNLSRFPLFFPEQRPFFTEGSAIFDFGRRQQTQMFYSRRIGLGRDGRPVNIPVGLRMQGRIGGEQVGLLAVRTGGAEDATAAVLRIKHDVLGRGYVGAMTTLAAQDGRSGSVAGGVDFSLPYIVQGGQNLVVLGNAAWSQDSSGAPVGGHYRLMVDYPNDNADIVMRFDRVDSAYNPTLGFVQQRGIYRFGGSTSLTPRPRRKSRIRRYEFDLLTYNVVWGLDWRPNNASLEVKPLGLQFQTGDRFEFNLQRRFDAPTEAFELIDGATIRPGAYWWNRAELQYTTTDARAIRLDATVSAGEFYTGRSAQASLGLRFRRTPHTLATVDLSREAVTLGAARFTANVVRVRSDYAFSPRLNATLFAQWDNQSNRASVNSRVRWTVTPGSDLYVVWNSNWPTGLDRPIPWSRPSRGGLVAKYVYFFRG
ncbi:MAG: carbohydrate binding family 9 domain-containing protein [Gemmatimonadaceae bacterium]|nr:carbohydrate binding family 9 domain-containing protein [Gemmatimonadaceae bacterium]